MESLAAVAMVRREPARAARLFGAAAALREAVGLPREPIDQRPYERHVAEVRTALSEAQFTAAWAEGRTMTLEDAVAEALAVADNPVTAAVG